MDAVFGLSRKKSTGVSYRELSLKDEFVFEDLDEFVMTSKCEFYRVMQ